MIIGITISYSGVRSCDISVSLVTWIWAGRPRNQGLVPGRGTIFFCSPKHPDQLWGPPRLLGVKQLGHETDYFLASNAEIKNAWSSVYDN